MPGRYRRYTPEFREEAPSAKMVVDGYRAIARVAHELGLSETTLGNWVRAYWETHVDDEPPLQLPERARLGELERKIASLGGLLGQEPDTCRDRAQRPDRDPGLDVAAGQASEALGAVELLGHFDAAQPAPQVLRRDHDQALSAR